MKISIDNVNVNYSVDGECGEEILLLHGWGANIKLFNGIIKFLSGFKKVYALDMPGFGESGEPPCSWNVDDYVDFVIKFMQKMNIKKVSILGHSFGGRVIIKMVNRKELPFEVDKLILVDSAGILPKKTFKKKVKIRMYKILKKVYNTKFVKKFFPKNVEEFKNKFGSEDYKRATPIMRESLVKVVNEDLQAKLKTIKNPTLLIWGENDKDTPYNDAKLMESLIPNSGLVTVKGAGHYSFLEQPNLVNAVLKSFLENEG